MILLEAFSSEGEDYLDMDGSGSRNGGGSSGVFGSSSGRQVSCSSSSSGRRVSRSGSSSGRRIFRGSGSSSSSRRRRLSCSESVLWTNNCPLVLAYSSLGTAVTFCGHFYFGFKVYFLMLNKIHA
jgi:hypothetical protein